jgi:signal transduction histidine kinase
VVGRAVRTKQGIWGLWAARSTASSVLVLRSLDGELVIGSILVLLVFGGAAWLLTSFALRPVAAMRRKAERLSGSGDTERLPVGQARDELASLAITLNAFLDRVSSSSAREKQLASDAAHELRTPLSALRTQLELAHDNFGDADALAREIMGAEQSVVRLSGLASGLLELSRLEADTTASTRSAPNILVDEAMGSIDRARMLGLTKHANIGFDVDDLDAAARYAIEPDSFARLLDNLLSNAVAAVGDGGAVELTIRQRDDSIEVKVSDDGPGIPSGFLAVAFDRFSRPDGSRSTATGGSGLGLALVRAIALSAGGSAKLRNGDRGAIATVRIPKM